MPFGTLFGAALIGSDEDAAIVAAIGRAERGSRGEVRVHLERRCPTREPLDRARELFGQLGMDRTGAARLKKRVVTGAFVRLACLGAALALGMTFVRSTLGAAWAEVERARAQVDSVRARRAEVEALYRGRDPSRERDAELMGAQNRIAIERRRYDEAAGAYNARASGPFGALVCGAPRAPCRAPTSSEIAGW